MKSGENWCEGFSLASLTVNGFLEFDMGDNTLTEGFYTLFTGNFINNGYIGLVNYELDNGLQYLMDYNTQGVLTLIIYAGSQPPPAGNSILWNGESGKWDTDANNKAWWGEDENSSCFAQGDTVYFEEGNGTITIEGEVRPAGINMSEGTYTFAGTGSIGGQSKLTISGGALTINNVNTYTGGTVVTGGTLQLNTAKAAGSGSILLNGTVASPVILALNVSTGSIANNVEVKGVASIVTMQDATLAGTLTGTGTLTKSGVSTLSVASLGLVSSSLGGLIIEEGTVSLSAHSQSYVSNLTITTAGTLNMGINSTLDVTGSATFADNASLMGKGVINVSANATLSLGAGINNDGIFINLAINAGLDIQDNAITIGALGGAGTVTSAGGELTIDTNISSTSNIFSGALSGTGDIIKRGDGEQIFQGVNTGNKTYNLTVEEGTVTLKGTSAGYTARFDVVDVQSYHTLKLDGTILEANQLNLTNTGHLSADGGSQAIVAGTFSATTGSKLTYSAVDEDMAAVVASTFSGTDLMDVVLDPAAFGWSNYVWQAVLTDSDSDFDLLQIIDVTRVTLTGFTEIASVIDGDTNYVEAWLGADAKNTTLHLAISDNARAGADLLWDANIQEARRKRDSTEGNSALNKVMRQMDSYSKEGDSAGYSRLASAVAGSSLGGVTQALSADFRQQTTWIRNRVTQMIVNQVETPVTAVMSYYNTGGGNAPTAAVIAVDTKWHLWGQANTGYSHANGGSHSDEAGYRLSSVGGTVGCNLDVSQRVTVGGAFTASSGNLTNHAADSLKGKLNTNYVNLFARVREKKWGHSIIATAGFGSAKLDRTVNVGNENYIAKGKPKTNAFGFMYELTYDYALNTHKTSLLQPIVNLSYTSNSIKNYKETGADGAGLNVSDMKANYFTLALGARAIKILDSGAWRVPGLLEGHILLAQDMGDRGDELTTGLQSGSLTRTIKGSEVGSFGVQIGGGISLEITDNTVFYINTDVDIRNKATNINASFGVRYDF